MKYSLVLLLLTIARVQGYSNDLNGTTSSSYVSNENRQHKQFNEKDFDQVFEHYRSEGRSREPRFVSFNTKDDNIEVEIDFAIPFLSIPVKRSLSGAMGTLQNVIRGIPMANINLGAVLLTGFVVVGGAMIGGISRLLSGGNFIEIAGNLPWFRPGAKKHRHADDDDVVENQWWRIIDQIDRALLKYDFDTTSCTQRVICWKVKDSLANINDKKASNIDHIISGLTSSDWSLQLISNTAWNDAVTTGRRGLNCESTFSQCKLSPKNMGAFASNLLQYAKKK